LRYDRRNPIAFPLHRVEDHPGQHVALILRRLLSSRRLRQHRALVFGRLGGGQFGGERGALALVDRPVEVAPTVQILDAFQPGGDLASPSLVDVLARLDSDPQSGARPSGRSLSCLSLRWG
jgi:hypothetical protein